MATDRGTQIAMGLSFTPDSTQQVLVEGYTYNPLAGVDYGATVLVSAYPPEGTGTPPSVTTGQLWPRGNPSG
jgi:hypothetical protein